MTSTAFDPAISATPWDLHQETVRVDWIDYNGHMNVAYYVLVFDHATDAVLDHLGAGGTYRAATGCSVFVVEAHVTYEQEVGLGDTLRVNSRLLEADGKRLRLYHEMRCPRLGGLVATNEVLCVNVSLASRRAVPWPDDLAERLRRAAADQAGLPRPLRAGRAITLSAKRPG